MAVTQGLGASATKLQMDLLAIGIAAVAKITSALQGVMLESLALVKVSLCSL